MSSALMHDNQQELGLGGVVYGNKIIDAVSARIFFLFRGHDVHLQSQNHQPPARPSM